MTSKIELHPVRNDPDKMKIVEGVLPQVSRDSAGLLRRIREADNCTCRLAYLGTQARGILVIADKVREIFGQKSLEIIALRLLDTQDDSKNKISSSLLQYATQKAEKKGNALHITIKNNENDFSDFFRQNGFKIIGTSAYGNNWWLKSISQESLPALLPAPEPAPIRQERRPVISEYQQMPLKNPYVQQIASGQKTIEGRINKGVFDGRRLQPGHRFCFFNQESRVYCRVKQVSVFSSFRDMLINTGVNNCLPGVRSLDEAVRIYDRIPNYNELAQQFGVVALHLEVETPSTQNEYHAGERRQRE